MKYDEYSGKMIFSHLDLSNKMKDAYTYVLIFWYNDIFTHGSIKQNEI